MGEPSLVGHVFAYRSGPAWPDVEPWLGKLWEAGIARLGGGAADGVPFPQRWSAGLGEVAAVDVAGVGRMCLRVDDAAITLTLRLCDGPVPELERSWDVLREDPPVGLIGSATLLVGEGAGEERLGPVGVLRSGTEVSEIGPTRFEDARSHRRLLVRPAGTPEFDELSRYLLEAARLRYELWVWSSGQSFREEAGRAQAAVEELRTMLTREEGPTATELSGDEERVRAAQQCRMALVETRYRLKSMQRFAAGCHARLVAVLPVLTGPFAEDGALADYFAGVLDGDATFVEAVADQAREVDTLASDAVGRRLVRQGEEQKARDEEATRRRERVNLIQAALVGALALALGAAQTFDLKPDNSWYPETKGALVAVLATTALLIGMTAIAVALPSRSRRFTGVLVAVAGAVVGAAVWLAVSTITGLPWWSHAVLAMVGFVAGIVVTLAVRRFRRALAVVRSRRGALTETS